MTRNHDYNTPAQGTQDWHTPLNENFEKLDVDVPVRDDEENRTDYTPHSEAMFISIDTGTIYRGDGATWVEIGSISGSGGSGGVSQEEVRDTVASFVSGPDKVSITHNDANNELIFETSAQDAEEVRDNVASFLTAGTNVTLTHDDGANTLTIDAAGGSSGGPTQFVINKNFGLADAESYTTDYVMADQETITVQEIHAALTDGTSEAGVVFSINDTAGNVLTSVTAEGNPNVARPATTYQNTSGSDERLVFKIENTSGTDYTPASAGASGIIYGARIETDVSA